MKPSQPKDLFYFETLWHHLWPLHLHSDNCHYRQQISYNILIDHIRTEICTGDYDLRGFDACKKCHKELAFDGSKLGPLSHIDSCRSERRSCGSSQAHSREHDSTPPPQQEGKEATTKFIWLTVHVACVFCKHRAGHDSARGATWSLITDSISVQSNEQGTCLEGYENTH